MPDEEEMRLRAVVVECHRLSLAASSALEHPVHRVVYGSEAHRKLVEANAIASEQYEVAEAALKAYRKTKKLIWGLSLYSEKDAQIYRHRSRFVLP
jgi:hypothetical protein